MLEIGEKYLESEVSNETFAEWARICNEDGTKHIDLINGYYIVNKNESLPERYYLEEEKRQLEAWLKAYDYVGTKIATRRATAEEYKDVIAEMSVKASRINEINKLLADL